MNVDHSRRYHNVFYAFRGASSGDPVDATRPQLEQNVTRALLITLERAGRATTARFIESMAGVPMDAECFRYDLEVVHRRGKTPTTILLGLSADGRITPDSLKHPEGQSRVDAVIEAQEVGRVLIESKLLGGCDGDQLWRHAVAWEQPEPVAERGGWRLPDNWTMRSWRDVLDWAVHERDAPDTDPVGPFLLSQLAEYLDLCGLTGVSPPARRAATPREAPLPSLGAGVDLGTVRELCRRLYGDTGTHHVPAADCRADMVAVVDHCRARGVTPPAGLMSDQKGGVITPRRLLSVLYGSDAYEQTALPQSHATASRKYLSRGIGRDCLVGVLAWAEQRTGPYRSYAGRLVEHAWAAALTESVTTPELAAALRERGVRYEALNIHREHDD